MASVLYMIALFTFEEVGVITAIAVAGISTVISILSLYLSYRSAKAAEASAEVALDSHRAMTAPGKLFVRCARLVGLRMRKGKMLKQTLAVPTTTLEDWYFVVDYSVTLVNEGQRPIVLEGIAMFVTRDDGLSLKLFNATTQDASGQWTSRFEPVSLGAGEHKKVRVVSAGLVGAPPSDVFRSGQKFSFTFLTSTNPTILTVEQVSTLTLPEDGADTFNLRFAVHNEQTDRGMFELRWETPLQRATHLIDWLGVSEQEKTKSDPGADVSSSQTLP